MRVEEYTVADVVPVLGLPKKVVANWIMRGFVKPSRSDKRGKRKHIHYFSYKELFWMACLRLLAIDLAMEYAVVVEQKKKIMAAAEQGMGKNKLEGRLTGDELHEPIKYGALYEVPLHFWGDELEMFWSVSGTEMESSPVAGGNTIILDHVKMFIDLRIAILKGELTKWKKK